MPHTKAEGPIPLGAANDIIWFARGRVAVAMPRTAGGGIDEAVGQLTERFERVGEKLALAIIITERAERPDDEMDTKIQTALDEIAPMLVCSAITVLGAGFFASFFMSFVSRVLKLTKLGRASQRIHTDLETAAAWMHPFLGDPNTSVADILETLRWAEATAA